eukprot:6123698-Amphidinium_carterae.2
MASRTQLHQSHSSLASHPQEASDNAVHELTCNSTELSSAKSSLRKQCYVLDRVNGFDDSQRAASAMRAPQKTTASPTARGCRRRGLSLQVSQHQDLPRNARNAVRSYGCVLNAFKLLAGDFFKSKKKTTGVFFRH